MSSGGVSCCSIMFEVVVGSPCEAISSSSSPPIASVPNPPAADRAAALLGERERSSLGSKARVPCLNLPGSGLVIALLATSNAFLPLVA